MDAEQLQQLALNAELNHWPPHLGVTTDAEKMEYLAARLREVATEHGTELEAAEEREESLESDNIDLSNENDRLKEQLAELKVENAELKAQLA